MKKLLYFSAIFFAVAHASQAQLPKPHSICGKDERKPSEMRPIARMMKDPLGESGCTGTLVSESCMISAGHCKEYLNTAQFNVPGSNIDGQVNYPEATSQYKVDQIVAFNDPEVAPEKGDWAVYHLAPNSITQANAGAVQGFYPVKSASVNTLVGKKIRITGYGAAKGYLNFTQQTALGEIRSNSASDPTMLNYNIDTMGGNSGSAILLEPSGEIVGIHVNGGCSEFSAIGLNSGTSITNHPEIKSAIQKCLKLK